MKLKDWWYWKSLDNEPYTPARIFTKFLMVLIVLIAWVIHPFVVAIKFVRKTLC